MLLYNVATDATVDVPDRAVNAWMRRGWTAVSPEPVEETEDKAENKSRGKSSATTKGKD